VPRLYSPSGAEFDLRSQLLFLDQPPTDPHDLVTATLAWTSRFIHESSHWARLHGSTVGILLTVLRRTRDVLAAHIFGQVDGADARRLGAVRSNGRRLVGYHDRPLDELVDRQVGRLGGDWLDLYAAYQVLLDPTGTPVAQLGPDEIWYAVDRALALAWSQSSGTIMLPAPPSFDVLTGDRSARLPSVDGTLLTTRLLFECAGVYDELYPQALGYLRPFTDPAIMQQLSATFDGAYGLPARVADRLAGRDLQPGVVLSLIDFALNPPVPGLHPDLTTVAWRELYPPSRFVLAASALADHRVEMEHLHPTIASVEAFHAELAAITGLRLGRVEAPLTTFASVTEALGTPAHLADIVPNVTLVFAKELVAERRSSVVALSHFGLNFVGEGALRFITADMWSDNWWLFAPLRVADGEYLWPEQIGQDHATDFLIGAAVAGAFDDAIHGVGPLSGRHLPSSLLQNDADLALIEDRIRKIMKMKLAWHR
jgi:hypothetical protein